VAIQFKQTNKQTEIERQHSTVSFMSFPQQ